MYNVYEKQNDINVRNAQIVYMAKELGMKPKEIKNYVDLALSTIRSYIHKFADMLDQAREWFGKQIGKITNKIKEKCYISDIITYDNCSCKAGHCSYIMEFFDKQHNFLFLKVGKADNVNKRAKEHLRYYPKHGYATQYVVVKEVHYTKDEDDALILEDLYRQYYKTIPDNKYKRNDRFLGIRYNKQDLEQDVALMTKVQMFEMAV